MVLFSPPESRVGGKQPSFPGKDGGRRAVFLNSQRPEPGEKREYGVPAQGQRIMNEDLGPAEPSAYGQHRPAQSRKRRLRRIQTPEPAAQGGGIRHAIGIFDRGCRSFPATALQEVALQRLAAGDQAVMAVGRRKRRQEGERLAAAVAKTAANPDPIVVFIMSLFAPAPMTDDGILHANRAWRRMTSAPASAQSASRLYCAAESEINSIVTVGAPLATLAFPKIRTRGRDLHLPSKIPTGKE